MRPVRDNRGNAGIEVVSLSSVVLRHARRLRRLPMRLTLLALPLTRPSGLHVHALARFPILTLTRSR
jgi:hypothetical protein